MKGPRLRYEHLDLGALPSHELSDRFDEMGEVVRDAALGCGEMDWVSQDWELRRSRTNRGTKAYLVWDGSILAGCLLYSSFAFAGRTCIHIKTGYVRSAYQGGGIGFSLSARVAYRAVLRRPLGEFLLVSDMLNPIVVAGWTARFPSVTRTFPADFGRPSGELAELAPTVASLMYPWADYDCEHSILRGKTTPRSGVIERSGNPQVDDYFRAHMDPTNGDTVLFLADFDHMTVFKGMVELVSISGRAFDRRLRSTSPGRR